MNYIIKSYPQPLIQAIPTSVHVGGSIHYEVWSPLRDLGNADTWLYSSVPRVRTYLCSSSREKCQGRKMGKVESYFQRTCVAGCAYRDRQSLEGKDFVTLCGNSRLESKRWLWGLEKRNCLFRWLPGCEGEMEVSEVQAWVTLPDPLGLGSLREGRQNSEKGTD